MSGWVTQPGSARRQVRQRRGTRARNIDGEGQSGLSDLGGRRGPPRL